MKRAYGTIILLSAMLLVCALFSCSSAKVIEERRISHPRTPTAWLDVQGIPSYDSSDPLLYHTGVSWNQRSLQLIEEAEEYIIISIFLGNLYEVSTEVWDALIAKMHQGVRVYCLVDSSSYFQTIPQSPIVIPAAFNYLRDAGIDVVEYNPFSLNQLAFIPTLLDRDHRKYWIIDGEHIVLGGINVNYASLAFPPETGNIDTMVEFASPGAITQMIDSFVATWNRYSPTRLDARSFGVPPLGEAATTVWMIDHQWPSRSETTTLFDAITLTSQEELWMVQGYTYLTAALKERIANAVRRGVKVNVMLSENAGKNNYQNAAYYSALDLIDAGATVYMYDDPDKAFLHLKLIVADHKYTVFGSPNYNLRSQTLSRELAAIFAEEAVAAKAKAHIDDLLLHCRVVSREEAQRWRTVTNYLYHLLMQVYG
ncbi:MAG: phosphatidylserine/phosphatidylglycerophosphate/cardiolipin synthase family protein [Sphaerochaeta sp.]|nr:phosphatidylserine/phosphatidylglycerophosphate/cardiolipin synthase family protein [Sphaerochaeta sp.]